MWYSSTTFTTTTYQLPSFSPMLTPVFSQAATQMAQTICGSSRQCKFDCAATENTLLAQSSANNSKGADLALRELGRLISYSHNAYRNVDIIKPFCGHYKNKVCISCMVHVSTR